jgi:mycothiol synthase
VPAFRGRGIGRALLLRAFVDLAGRGYEAVMPDVDAGNETGATRPYEGVGMAVVREWRIMVARILGTSPGGLG